MKRIDQAKLCLCLAGIFAAAAVVAGCGDDGNPLSMCDNFVRASCDRIFECFTPAEIQSMEAEIGSDVYECYHLLGVRRYCGSLVPICGAGRVLDEGAALDCTLDLGTYPCIDLRQGGMPSVCEDMCYEEEEV